jgi:hypothetical protein
LAQSDITVTLPDGRQFVAPSAPLLEQWAKEGRIPADAVITQDGSAPVVASRHPQIAVILGAPPTMPGPVVKDSGMSSLIPYRNPMALTGYYISIASLIPILGLLLAPIAFVLGVMGLRYATANPTAKGKAHAVVAIALGGLMTLVWVGATLFVLTRR